MQTRTQIIEALVSRLSHEIDRRLADGETYRQARAAVQEASIAGPAVWARLDLKYSAF